MTIYCIEKGCPTRSSFAFKGMPSKYCNKHKKPNMINVRDKRCKELNCPTIANFGHEGGKKEYCAKHKKPNMINVTNKLFCKGKTNGVLCKTRPSFALKGNKPQYCFSHKLKDMINVTNKRLCAVCGTTASFGVVGGKPTHCAKHKTSAMKNLHKKKCLKDGCEVEPIFGFEGKKALYCAKHRLPDMVNLKDKTCLKEGCPTLPTYAYKGERPKYCTRHKLAGMINVKNKACEGEGCIVIPAFANDGEKARFCIKHKEPNMINVKTKKCINYNTCKAFYTRKKFKEYCFKCFLVKFPSEAISRNFKTKELAVAKDIKENFSNVLKYATFDKIIAGGKSKKRPDILFRFKTHNIIIETDEDEHCGYNGDAEKERIRIIREDLNGEKLILIKFNPDGYADQKGIKYVSCWNSRGAGICTVKNHKKWQERLEKLRETITYWLTHAPKKQFKQVELFFSCY